MTYLKSSLRKTLSFAELYLTVAIQRNSDSNKYEHNFDDNFSPRRKENFKTKDVKPLVLTGSKKKEL